MENPNAYQAKPDTPTRRRAALQTLKPGQGNVSMLQRIKNFVAPPRDFASVKKVEDPFPAGHHHPRLCAKVALRNPRAKPIISRRMQIMFPSVAMPQRPRAQGHCSRLPLFSQQAWSQSFSSDQSSFPGW